MNFELPVSAEILSEISTLDRFQGQWSAQQPIPSTKLRRIEEAAQIQSVASSCRLAGIRVTDADVAAILRSDAPPVGDAGEILGYRRVLQSDLGRPGSSLDSEVLRRLHAEMLGGDLAGGSAWRTAPLHREAFDAEGKATGQVFPTLPSRLVEGKTDELLAWLEYEQRSPERNAPGQRTPEPQAPEQHAVLVVGMFVLCLQAISPFDRANGRLGRLLTSLLLRRAGYSAIPFASLEARMEELRSDYFGAIFRSQTGLWTDQPNAQPWLSFFLLALRRHRERLQTKIELERRIQDYPPLQQVILETVREHGTVDAALLLQATGANRNTLKDNLRRLVQHGVLDKLGERRGTRYRMSSGEGASTGTWSDRS